MQQKTYLKDYLPSPFLIQSIDLTFELNPKETIVTSKLAITRNPNSTLVSSNLIMDGINLTLLEIKIDGQPLSGDKYQITPEQLIIKNVPPQFNLTTKVKICPEKNLTCSGLYLSNNNFCTQNEPCGFRRLTYFIDRPDILTKFTTTIIADKTQYPILLSNGNLIAQKTLENNQHSTTWQDPFPKSAYLFALVAGKFGVLKDQYTTSSGRIVTLQIFANEKQLSQCHYAMHALKQAMQWDEKNFGLEYDLDTYNIVATDDFNFGAMENKGLNIFNSKLLLASPNTATDSDFNRIAAVVAHEYFHNYTGNRVTCRDWFQIGLKEGLTTFREQLFMEDIYGYITNRIDSIKTIRTRQFAEDAGPLAHPIRLQSYIEINNFYTVTVYEKSAEIARMLCTIFGREKFQQIMKTFLTKFDGQAVTIEDFLQTAAEVTQTNLEQFKSWYDQAGTPKLKVSDCFNDNKIYNLHVKTEGTRTKQDHYIPLAIGLVTPNEKQPNTEILIIDKKEHSFPFTNIPNKPIPSLLRGFSAPIKIEYEYNDADLLTLIQYDEDPINAWNASQQLMINTVKKLYEHNTTDALDSILHVFKIILDKPIIDPALTAQMLQFPTENLLHETFEQIDIEKIHNISEHIKTTIGKKLTTELLNSYNSNQTLTSYSFEPASIGKRSLKNTCLYYLMHLDDQNIYNLCLQQLENADNLTDAFASLAYIANSQYANRKQILENQYIKWSYDTNLVNKWLALNANIKLPNTLARIKNLTNHPAFNNKNPNKVYSLIRAFCENNHINFHESTGAGYCFLTKQILTIDKFNPQLAAALVSPLTHGYKMDQNRQNLMREQLLQISKEPTLSKNVFEIVTKTLEKD